MRKLFLGAAVLLFATGSLIAQTKLTGAQLLRNARLQYDQGRLHELPGTLGDVENTFTSDVEKVEAYKLLVLTYIYLEEPQKADDNMLALLRTDHFFVPVQSDQVEFKNLYNKYRTWPIFSVGLRAGLNQTFVNALKNYYVVPEGRGAGTYSPVIGVNLALAFELKLKNKLMFNPELMYQTSAFTYENDKIFFNDYFDTTEPDDQTGSMTHTITQTRIQLNLLGQYQVLSNKLNPYIFAGPAVGYLVSSSFEGLLHFEDRYEVAGQVDNTANYKRINFSVIAGAGFKYKMGSVYLTGDIRYQYGLGNIAKADNRFEQTPENIKLQDEFYYIDNDINLQNAMFHLGIIYPYFKPKKLIR